MTTRALELWFLAVMLFRSSLLLTVLFPCLTGFETQIRTSTVSSNSPPIVRRLPTLDSALRHFDTLRTDEIKKHRSLARKNRGVDSRTVQEHPSVLEDPLLEFFSLEIFLCTSRTAITCWHPIFAQSFQTKQAVRKFLRKSTEKSFTLERVGWLISFRGSF